MNRLIVQSAWAERMRDPNNPLWLRIYSLAEDSHDEYGHTRLVDQHREIRRCLGDDLLTSSLISRGIAKAIEQGWIHPSSSARCIVLPWGVHSDCDGHRTRGHR